MWSEKCNVHARSAAEEARLIDCYRRMSDAARQELVVYAKLLSDLQNDVPDNVIPFPAQ